MLTKIPFGIIMEWMCLIASILLTKAEAPKFWKLFIPYLLTTACVESYCLFLVKTSSHAVSTHWIYNIFMFIYLCFHLFIFSRLIALPYIKNLVKIIFFGLLVSYFSEWYFFGFAIFFATTNVLFGISIIIFSVFYYYSLFYQDQIKNITAEPVFWIITGCFIFYTGSTAVNLNINRLIVLGQANSFPFRYALISILNIVMYSCWIKSFLCFFKAQTYSR
jgi:hypothetical protein